MLLETYPVIFDRARTIFEFISEGPKGKIIKLIQFTEVTPKNLYNLGFGDKDILSGEIDDKVISNNRDSQKVLATIAATVYLFLEVHPNAWIYAFGATQARTRLYRMGISNNFRQISKDFEVYGLIEERFQEFEKGKDYKAFLLCLHRKKV